MKYVWLFLVIIGSAGIFLGYQRYQIQNTQFFGEYPCFFCVSEEPDFEVVIFSAPGCDLCEQAVKRSQRFCKLTGIQYEAFYDDAEITSEKLSELGLEKNSDFLIVILKNGTIVGKSTDSKEVESFLSGKLKEAVHL